jgi:hypothetical protein
MQFLVLAKARAEAFKNGPPADFAQVAAEDSAHAQKAYLSGALRQMWMRDSGNGPVAIVERSQRKTFVRFSPNGRFSRSAIWKSMSLPCIPITALGAAKSDWPETYVAFGGPRQLLASRRHWCEELANESGRK